MTKVAKLIGTEYDVWGRWEKGYIIGRDYYKTLKSILKEQRIVGAVDRFV